MEDNNGMTGGSPVLSLLRERERTGIKRCNRGLFFDKLSSHAAWNRRRIRDMALVVGPNTPAATESSTATSLRSATVQQHYDSTDDGEMDTEDDSSTLFNHHKPKHSNNGLRPTLRSSIKHRGCINTASWLTAGWKLSFSSNSLNSGVDNIFKSVAAQLSEECPTQLMTSGDDRTVMFWDVSAAMGSTTLPQFSHPTTRPAFSYVENNDDNDYTRTSKDLSGFVTPLGTLPTSHRGNIFHVAPVPYQPGLISTCAADGSLQVGDVERALGPSTLGSSSSSSASQSYTTIVVTSPEFVGSSDEPLSVIEWLSRSHSSMAFTHCFLNRHIGLLCSERGLHKFDLRLSPREQPRENLFVLPRPNEISTKMVCKACALWNQHKNPQQSLEDQETWYAFAGGISGVVGLYDLRMDGSSAANSRALQTYIPSTLGNTDRNTITHTSVSGLGVSKDGTELLVSYDSDQIYTFDVVPSQQPFKEKAMYGGHLNRCTFLKEAKYAGPRDEYICTGSDSGHAWLYDRDSGSVAALLKADRNTCNGVIPHPTLPYFITYGIDSTAKLWRAINNPTSTWTSSRPLTYKKSALVSRWKDAQRRLSLLPELEEDRIPIGCLPNSLDYGFHDEDDSNEADESYFIPFIRHSADRGGSRQHDFLSCKVGNSLIFLPELLQFNYDTCYREVAAEKADTSVHSGLHALARNISVSRLRHQADRLGLTWDREVAPWVMEFRASVSGHADLIKHPADLIPDFPMDWMPYDAELIDEPKDFWSHSSGSVPKRENSDMSSGDKNSTVVYDKPWLKLYNEAPPATKNTVKTEEGSKGKNHAIEKIASLPRCESLIAQSTESLADDKTVSKAHLHPYSEEHALDVLLKTILILKDGGNKAMEAGCSAIAAQRYDKAISYCSLVFLTFPVGNLNFLDVHHSSLIRHKGVALQWTPLLKAMITIRLNLSMAMQKPELADWDSAVEQARLALQELKPFTITPGRAVSGKVTGSEEVQVPETVYNEAKEIQAKAYFRLGTAQYSAKNYSGAVSSYEKSLQSMKQAKPEVKPDSAVLRRLAEAKRDKARKEERVRKKFKNSIHDEGK